MLSMRIIPLIPGWFINLVSPFMGISLWTFFLTTFIGLMPFHYICISVSSTLSSINSISDILSPWIIMKFMFIGGFLLSITLYKNKIMGLIFKYLKKDYHEVDTELADRSLNSIPESHFGVLK
jgi:uncharacterized membrane protein YdjX (TVP38/TMEM64 family)